MAHTELPQRTPLKALMSAMRPRQWVKNGLIVIAPAAAGVLTPRGHHPPHGGRLPRVLLRLLGRLPVQRPSRRRGRSRAPDEAVPGDRVGSTPLRRRRWALPTLLLLVGFAIPFALWHPEGLFLVLGLYVVIQVNYIVWMKNVVIIELASVASGFILRAWAGAAASHIYVSTWFLVVISFGALFLVVGKRSSELETHGAGATRKVLAQYTPEFLHSALTLSATVVVTGYCLWAFDTSSTGLSSIHHDLVPIRLSVVPVVLAVLFIIRASESTNAEAPEELLLHNRTSRCSSSSGPSR